MQHNDALRDQYDSLYATSDDYIYNGGKALKVLEDVRKLKSSGRVLDVGGGDGRNAIYLARAGFDVTVVDLSVVGLEKLQRFAAAEAVAINTVTADITKEIPAGPFDVVVCSNVLHHVDTAEVTSLLTKLISHTSQGGLHVISTFIHKGQLFERNEFKGRFYPSPEELTALYGGWNTIHLETKETTTRARAKDGSRLKNWLVNLVVQKP